MPSSLETESPFDSSREQIDQPLVPSVRLGDRLERLSLTQLQGCL